MCDIIEQLQEKEDVYCIDFLPCVMLNEQYFDLEDYLLETYIEDFAKKISNIVLKLIHYYSAQIYLTEAPEEYDGKYLEFIGEDIRQRSLQELADIIQYVITKDFSSIQILLEDASFLISINGEFSVDVYNPSEENVNFIRALVQQEGLFLRKV